MDAFFALSKVLTFVLLPVNFVVGLTLVAGIFACFARTKPWAIRLGAGAGLAFLILAVLPLGPLLVLSLERRFPSLEACPLPESQAVAGIILLGGGVSSTRVDGEVVDTLNEAGDRVWYAAALARRYPDARILVSGGQAFDNGTSRPESDATAVLLEAAGVEPEQIIKETYSRTTAENAAFSANVTADGYWLIVTSAFHMPRAIGTFRRSGVAAIAAPTDWRVADLGTPLQIDPIDNLSTANLAAKEYLGLAAYYISGRSTEFLPGQPHGYCTSKDGLHSAE